MNWCGPLSVIPEFGRERLEGQELKTSFGFTVNSRITWAETLPHHGYPSL